MKFSQCAENVSTCHGVVASLQLARHERRKLVVGLVFLVGSGVHIGFQLGLDYGLYWMLTMIRTHGELRVHNDGMYRIDKEIE